MLKVDMNGLVAVTATGFPYVVTRNLKNRRNHILGRSFYIVLR